MKEKEMLTEINDKLDFIISGLGRQVVEKSALGQPKIKVVSGEEFFNQWKERKNQIKIIPNENPTK